MAFSGSGAGTSGDPYQITTIEQLNEMRDSLSSFYKLMNDLDFNDDASYSNSSNKSTYTTGAGWVPVGTSATAFSGGLDGDGHTIDNLFIVRTSDYTGFFGNVQGNSLVIKDLYLTNINISGRGYCGGLFGNGGSSSNTGNISNVHVTGTVTITSTDYNFYVGGFGGGYVRGTFIIENCSFEGTLAAPYAYAVGGFCNQIEGTVRFCKSSATITNGMNGGSCGAFVSTVTSSGRVQDCYSYGGNVQRVSGASLSGLSSFCRYNNQGKIINCFTTTPVTYLSGTPPTNVGFCHQVTTGGNYEDVDNFFDTEETAQSTTSGSAKGRTTAQMQNILNYTDEDYPSASQGVSTPWDIVSEDSYVDETWFIATGEYPKLSWEFVEDTTQEFSFSEDILISDSQSLSLGFFSFSESLEFSESFEYIDPVLRFAEDISLTDDGYFTENKFSFSEGISISDLVELIEPQSFEFSEGISFTDNISHAISAPYGIKILSYNPLIFVSGITSIKIVKVDTTDPENPVHTVYNIPSATSVNDIFYSGTTNRIYVSCGDGEIVSIDADDLDSQLVIDLSDADDIFGISFANDYGVLVGSTTDATGELYLLDDRDYSFGDCELYAIATKHLYGDCSFFITEKVYGDCECVALRVNTDNYGDCFFACYPSVITPIKVSDFVVYLDGVQLGDTDINLESIIITHGDSQKSQASFILNRKHDDLDYTLGGDYKQITGQNTVRITILGQEEFVGKISSINCNYETTFENVDIVVLGDVKEYSFKTVNLSLPSVNGKLGLYEVLVQKPRIENPYIDPNEESPAYYKGVSVDMGETITQVVSRWRVFDSTGSIAEKIEDGSFVADQNWTYFWSVSARKFGVFTLGQTSSIYIPYIGTSLSPVSSDLWSLTNVAHYKQRVFEDKVESNGTFTVGEAPFKSVSAQSGVLNTTYRWSDEPNGMFSIKDESYDYTNYAVRVANAEYQKMLNINGDILPITSCSLKLTVDSYLYNQLKPLTRVNVENTTRTGIYKNNNGFPVAIKSITISANDRSVSIEADNKKSQIELDTIDATLPDPDNFITSEKRIFLHPKTDMKTFLEVE